MQEVSQSRDNEIDLYELFETLWSGKWFISGFVAISVLLSGGFLFIETPIYESRLVYRVENPPAFYQSITLDSDALESQKIIKEKVKTDFRRLFYSKNTYESWKVENTQSELIFENFNKIKVTNDFIFIKDEVDLLAKLTEEKSMSFLVVKTNNLLIINDFFSYQTYTNNLLTNEYLARVKEELQIIEKRYQTFYQKEFLDLDVAIFNNVLDIDRYMNSVAKGVKALTLSRPTYPKKISPKGRKILILSVVFGGMIGAMYVFVSNYIRKRKTVLSRQ